MRRRHRQGTCRHQDPYRAIFEGSLDGLFLWDGRPRIVDVNPAGLALYGYRREDLVGRSYPTSMPAEYVEERLVMVRRALAGQATHLETTVLRPNGTSFEADLRVLPFSQGGRPHALAVVRDITERRQRERELQRSEAQYRAIFNASIDALVLRDAAFRIVEVNPTYEAMTGNRRADVLGADRVLANPPEAGEAIRALHAQALAGHTVRFETHLLHRNGVQRDVELRGVPVVYRGEPHVLYMGRDISDRVAAERRRAELERQLRQAQKMEAIGQLTGGLAHDFNNILTSVLGYVTMAQEHPAAIGDVSLGHELAQARVAAEIAREHVAQLLAFSRPQRGERRLLEPASVAGEALHLLRPNLPSSIAVAFDAAGSDEARLPPVVADPVQFEQVLLNLCINARDAIRGNGTVRLRVDRFEARGHCASCGADLGERSWVVFEVADDGDGMTADVLEHMFEPFFTTKDAGRGTGLGLAMVHGIVHDHDGHLQVASERGSGSSFRVLLPPAPQAAHPAECASPPARAVAAAALHGRVLVVEDEPRVGAFMGDLLAGWGLAVTLEHDPLAALRRLEAAGDDIDLLITDLTMPGMNGLALARCAREARTGLPVLLYTGNACGVDEQELARSGVDALLRKPVDAARLRTLLARLLAARLAV